jgi:hypothetical protein
MLALFPAWTGGREAVLGWLTNARRVAFTGIAAAALIGGTALAANGHTGAAAPWMQKICGL